MLPGITVSPVVNAKDENERLFWKTARCGESEMRLYLEEYPRGAYVDEAIECLREIGATTEKGRREQERQWYDSA